MFTRSKGKVIEHATATAETEPTQPNSSCAVRSVSNESTSASVVSTVEPADTTPSGASQAPNDANVDRANQYDEGNSTLPQSNVSFRSERTARERTQSSRSSAAVHAEKLALEADFSRRLLYRELELARLESEAEQRELQAKLAALDAKDKSCSSHISSLRHRTMSWVHEQNVPMAGTMSGGAPTFTLDCIQGPPVQSAVRANEAPLPHATFLPATARPALALEHIQGPPVQSVVPANQAPVTTNNDILETANPQDNSIAMLAHAITALADRPKKPDLVPFSGDVNQWLAFKSSYDRSNGSFSSGENITRLHNAIRGPAYQSVASLLWTSSDPQEIVDALQQTYARPEILVAREISDIQSSPKISTPELLNVLANKLRNFVTTIKLLNQIDYLYSPELFRCILMKLSEHTRSRFTDFAADHMPVTQNMSKLETLSKFLLTEADKHLKYNFVSLDISKVLTRSQNPTFTHKTFFKKEAIHATTSSDVIHTCNYCKKGEHLIRACKSFLSLSIDDRWQWIRDSKTCYRCLKSYAHLWNSCRARRCGVDGCTRRHHALLHGQIKTNNEISALTEHKLNNTCIVSDHRETEPIQIANTAFPHVTGTSQQINPPRGLLKVVAVVLIGPNGEYETTALLDEGSTATLIDAEVAARIGATPTQQERVRIEGVGDMSKVVDISYVNFYIRGRNLSDHYLIEHARAIKPLSLRVPTVKVNVLDYHHLATTPIELSTIDKPPSILIGAPDWHLTISREVRCGHRNEPVASKTLLGWVLHGALSNSSRPTHFVNHCRVNEYTDDLDALIRSQYDIDSLGIMKSVPRQNVDDARAVNIIDTTARRLADGRFEVSLPWKECLPKVIPDSYPQALSRLKTLEKQMSKDPDYDIAFKRFVADILAKGYAEECDASTYHKSISSTESEDTIRWYLPIFGVFHPQKKKLRAVHDAAANSKGVSLNSMLLQGPDLLRSLIDILFRFREGPVALNADIKEMFPQVKIARKDRNAQRFLWRTDGVIREYRMSSMIFGAVCSPFIALHLMNKNAKEMATTYPEACSAIMDDHYMDDYLGSHFSVTDAIRIASDIVTVHKNCQFEMRSWTSNVPEALSQLPKDLRSDIDDVSLPSTKEVGILGLKWNPAQDTLTFRSNSALLSEPITKRIILSNVMKLYDPLGLLMPVTIWGRIIIQKLWREGVGWDTPLPGKYVDEYKHWFQYLKEASSVKIPRCYLLGLERTDIQLHIIADGGEQAYACVAYWRITYTGDTVSVVLIGSKARVAPLKPLSIPRLELQAALIASRFSSTITKAHRLKPSRYVFWTDSTTVLKWIKSDARNFKPFVAHRLGEIAELSNPSDWRWLPTSLNVADDATKPKTNKLEACHRWFLGPPFLLQAENYWPIETQSNVAMLSDPELKSEIVGILVEAPLSKFLVPNPKRFSRWLRLLRATARVFQCARIFISKISRPANFDSSTSMSIGPEGTTSPTCLQEADLALAEKTLLRHSQWDSFADEIKHLRASQPLPKSSRIAFLATYLDTDGLLRVETRIKLAPGVNHDTKAPIILDGRNHIVRLIVHAFHIKMSHGFDETVLNEIQQKYKIINARSTIKNISSSCTGCRRYKGHPTTPPIGDLPVERMEHHKRPFTYTGLDYFGPFTVLVGRRQEKRYVALYTCLVTRAIHLEVVTSLSADAALTSLRRFIARRGSPMKIFSDNGTNFVGANRELRALHDSSVIDYATNSRIKWHFIPPAAPFMGGAWERMVRTVKNALRATLKGRSHPKDETFTTLLVEAEAIVNSRPLSYVPTSINAPEALTPFHFLIGTSSVVPWTNNLTDGDLSRRQEWRKVLRLADHFWARWLREYLPTLRRKEPRNRSTQDLREGDVVLIADNTLPRGLWPLGRVLKTYPGPDGRVRVVDLFTKGGTLRRPSRKLVLMDTQPVTTEG